MKKTRVAFHGLRLLAAVGIGYWMYQHFMTQPVVQAVNSAPEPANTTVSSQISDVNNQSISAGVV